MKTVVFLFLSAFSFASLVFGQEITLNEFETSTVEIQGTLGENTAITISLNVHEVSYFDLETYSVKGWYYYDKYKKKIPLVGIYNGDLTLFSSKSKGFSDSILSFTAESDSPWDILYELLGKQGFDEKMSLTATNGQLTGTWTNTKKELGVLVFAGSLNVRNHFSFLFLPTPEAKTAIDLAAIGISETNLKLESSKMSKADFRVILSYDSPSSGMINGRCGGGRERGFIYLVFDNEGLLLEKSYFEIESCNAGIWGEEEPPKEGVRVHFHITYSDETTAEIIVDKGTTTITKK